MKRWGPLCLVGLCTLAGIGLALISSYSYGGAQVGGGGIWGAPPPSGSATLVPVVYATAERIYRPRPTTIKSEQEIIAEAIRWTYVRADVLSGVPEVVFARRVTSDQLRGLGFGWMASPTNDYPQMVVIVRGDFDLSKTAFGPSGDYRYGYLAYNFDMYFGETGVIATSRRGGRFRHILNDPSLPDDWPLEQPTAPPLTALPITATLSPASTAVPTSSFTPTRVPTATGTSSPTPAGSPMVAPSATRTPSPVQLLPSARPSSTATPTPSITPTVGLTPSMTP
jgi:hypothetical protein